jgi:hypothetical protein
MAEHEAKPKGMVRKARRQTFGSKAQMMNKRPQGNGASTCVAAKNGTPYGLLSNFNSFSFVVTEICTATGYHGE